jgi:uncharacterized protein YecT (DUF1311 family)
MKLGLLVAASVLAATGMGSAHAQDLPSGLSQKYLACQERAGRNTVQIGICAQTEMAAQDARLNKAYQQVMRQLANKPEERIALRNAERSWLKRRDYECKIDQQTIDNGCLVAKTADRANELESRVRF